MDTITNFKGLNLDVLPEKLQDGEYTFALNALVAQPDLNSIHNLEGNELCIDLDGRILGHIHIPKYDKYILFLDNNSIVEFYYLDCFFNILYENDCLNFNSHIRGVYKTLTSCNEIVIVWVDGVNPVRHLNIDKINVTSCKDLDLFSCDEPIKVEVEQILDIGGVGLESGSYQFAAQYVGETLTSNYFFISQPVPIYEASTNTNFDNIDGTGTITTKAIRLSFDLDLNIYTGINLAVIKNINGVITSEVILLNGTRTEYIYDGSTQGTEVNIAEILTPNTSFVFANLIEEHQGRLFLSGLKRAGNLNYQQYANDIDVTYFTKRINIQDGYKDPLMSLNKSMRANEIYSLGIQWVYCDGSTSFAFHIPGRRKMEDVNPLDKEKNEDIYNNKWGFWDSSIVGTDDPNNFFECEKERWEIYNTSYRTAFNPFASTVVVKDDCGTTITTVDENYSEGVLSYFQTNERYPDQRDCNGDLLYPHTILPNGDIEMDYVRHHKMPDRTNEPHYTFDAQGIYGGVQTALTKSNRAYDFAHIHPIGLKFDNIYVPDSDLEIVGYNIVYTKRDDSNRTVVSSGIYIKTYLGEINGDKEYALSKFPLNGKNYVAFDIDRHPSIATCTLSPDDVGINNEEEEYVFYGPDTLFTNRLISSTHSKIDMETQGGGVMYGDTAQSIPDENGDKKTYLVNRYNINLNDTVNYDSTQVNRQIEGISYADANSITNGGTGFTNSLLNTARERCVFLSHTNDDKLVLTNPNPNPLLCGVTPDDHVDYSDNWLNIGGDTEITRAACMYGQLNRYRLNPYGNFNSLTFIPTGLCSKEVEKDTYVSAEGLCGDSFINYFTLTRTRRNHDGDQINGIGIQRVGNALINIYVESDINVGLRREGDLNAFETHYPKLMSNNLELDPTLGENAIFGSLDSTTAAENCLLTQQYWDDSDSTWSTFKDPNYYNYNIAHSAVNDLNEIPIIPITYKDCDCETELTNTIAVSEIDNIESNIDSWRIFKINNYLTVPHTQGDLTNIFTLNNNFYAHSTDNIWRIFTSQDRLLSEANIYIGTGSIFEQAPLYMYATNEGFAGMQQYDGWYKNHYGYFFIDSKSGTFYRFNESIEKLDVGISDWLEHNILFKDDISPLNRFKLGGKGWHITFDKHNERMLITKRDRVIDPNIIYNNGMYQLGDEVVDINDYSCDASWTLSYSFLTQQFMSWHSYKPYLYLPTRNTRHELYSVIDDGIYRHYHSDDIIQHFYGKLEPHVIELKTVDKYPLLSSVIKDVSYVQDSYRNASTLRSRIATDETFNKALIHNNRESTKELTLLNKLDVAEGDILTIQGEDTYVDKVEQLWSFNDLKRATKGELTGQMLIYDCANVTSELNPDNIENYEWYDEPHLRNNYYLIRLIKDDDNPALFTKYVLINYINNEQVKTS